MPKHKMVLSEEKKAEIENLMKDNLSIRQIARALKLADKTLRSHYPDYRTQDSVRNLTEAQREIIEKSMQKGLSIRQICALVKIKDTTLKSLYPGYQGKRGGYNTAPYTPSKRSENYRPTNIEKDALYNPIRHGVPTVGTLTAQLLGDPPPGRRELIERWSQNSIRRRPVLKEAHNGS